MNNSRLRRLRDRLPGPATLINEGCKIKGLISGDGDFLISGEIDGDCDLRGTVTLAKIGLWQGTISARDIIICGQVEGDIIAGNKVEIAQTARITGNVTAEAIAVAEGAVVDGVMKTTGQTETLKFVEKRSNDK